MEPKQFTDIDEKNRVFEFKAFAVPTGFAVEATEILDGEPKGMTFSALGKEEEVDTLRHKLEERIKKALATKHVEYDKESDTWVTCDHIIRGQIRWDSTARGQIPLIVVDGHELTWELFGKSMLVYEGSQFVLKFVDPTDDLHEVV